MEIKKYSKADKSLLFDLLVDEGDEWSARIAQEGEYSEV